MCPLLVQERAEINEMAILKHNILVVSCIRVESNEHFNLTNCLKTWTRKMRSHLRLMVKFVHLEL